MRSPAWALPLASDSTSNATMHLINSGRIKAVPPASSAFTKLRFRGKGQRHTQRGARDETCRASRLAPPAAWEDHPGGDEGDGAAERGVVDALGKQRPVAAFAQQ